jgi:hypothetical protein
MDRNKRAQELIAEMVSIADDNTTPIERARLKIRTRLLALQAMLREPRTLAELDGPWWEDSDAEK